MKKLHSTSHIIVTASWVGGGLDARGEHWHDAVMSPVRVNQARLLALLTSAQVELLVRVRQEVICPDAGPSQDDERADRIPAASDRAKEALS